MSFTIEHRIFELVCERLRQHFAGNTPDSAILAIPVGDDVKNIDLITISGNFTGLYSRSFEISKVSDGVCHIKEVTLFAELGNSAPVPFDDDVLYSDGVAFEVAGSGMSIAISADAEDGMEWMLRMGNAFMKIPDIWEHPIDYAGKGTPCICVYASGNTSDALVLEKLECVMDLDILLCLGKEAVENGDHLEILGDIRNMVMRDPHLWDGATCLSENFAYRGDIYYEQTDRGNSIFLCNCQITYRSSIKNARIK